MGETVWAEISGRYLSSALFTALCYFLCFFMLVQGSTTASVARNSALLLEPGLRLQPSSPTLTFDIVFSHLSENLPMSVAM